MYYAHYIFISCGGRIFHHPAIGCNLLIINYCILNFTNFAPMLAQNWRKT